MVFKKAIFLLCLLSLVFSFPATSQAAEEASADEMRALAVLNADRTKHGLLPLAYSSELTKLAEDYAQDMMARGFFAHNDPDGLTPFDRMNSYGIRYRYAGENLALNDNVEAAQAAFMNSPTHRANVLNPNYSQVGIGVKYADNGKVYVVQEFTGQ